MIFTKLMAFALVLLMAVSAFAACNGKNPPDTTPETTAPETTAPETTVPEETTPAGCLHKNSLKKTGNDKSPTCTEEGYIERKCTRCNEIVRQPVEKIAHTSSKVKSVDGKYTREVCSTCGDVSIVDEAGMPVADVSAIEFPLFAATLVGIENLEELSTLFEGFSVTPKFANIVKNDPNGELYLNIPAGNVKYAPNGCLDLNDLNAQLIGKAFVLTFDARYEELPTGVTALLTWTVDGNSQVLLSCDKNGNYINAAGDVVAKCSKKGWDNFKVEFAADGRYTIYLKDAQIATGKVVASGASSVIRFFDLKNQFEAYLTNIIVTK